MYSHYGRSAEWELRDILEAKNVYVLRSAASRGIDLIGILPGVNNVRAYEVKATGEDVFYCRQNKAVKEQYDGHIELSKRIPVSYAVRFGKEWREFPLDGGGLDMILRKNEGMPILPPNISL